MTNAEAAELALVPDLDHLAFNYFPRNVAYMSRVRSIRIASVPAATDPDADGIYDTPGEASQAISFGWGGIVYEFSASSTGAGIDTSRNTTGNQTFELRFRVSSGYGDHVFGQYQNNINNFLKKDSARADALFGENGRQDQFFHPVIFVPRNGSLIATVMNGLSSVVTLINIVVSTIEPIEMGGGD